MVVAGLLAQELGHHQVDVGALGNEMAVPAMVVDQVIVGAHRDGNPRCHRLLPGRQVHRSVHLARRIQLVGHVLEVADGAHRAVEPDEAFVGQLQFGRAFLEMLA